MRNNLRNNLIKHLRTNLRNYRIKHLRNNLRNNLRTNLRNNLRQIKKNLRIKFYPIVKCTILLPVINTCSARKVANHCTNMGIVTMEKYAPPATAWYTI